MNTQNSVGRATRFVSHWGRRGLGCLTILLMIIFIYYGLYFILKGSNTTNPQLIAHRGGRIIYPENTLSAFRHAIDIGADWIEFDVQRTQDNVLVVIHDDTVDRTTNGSGEVGQLSLEQIQALDAGDGEVVPTFEQVISLAKENEVGIMPEAKSPELYPDLSEQILRTLEKENYLDSSILQSFDPESLILVREKNADLAVCPLSGLWQFDLNEPQPDDAESVCPMAEMVLLYPWMIRQAHQDGRKVFVWFGIIESPLVMRSLLAMGADGLMVDDPVTLAKIRAPGNE